MSGGFVSNETLLRQAHAVQPQTNSTQPLVADEIRARIAQLELALRQTDAILADFLERAFGVGEKTHGPLKGSSGPANMPAAFSSIFDGLDSLNALAYVLHERAAKVCTIA